MMVYADDESCNDENFIFFNLEPTFYNLFSNKPENAVQHRLLAELKRLKI